MKELKFNKNILHPNIQKFFDFISVNFLFNFQYLIYDTIFNLIINNV